MGIKDVEEGVREIAKVLGKDIVVFDSVVKNYAVKNESDLDIAIKSKLLPEERKTVYDPFAERIYEKHRVILVLHEIPKEY